MKKFNYADEKIGSGEIMIAVPSMIMGVGVIFLPKLIAMETVGADGWISILVGGLITICIVWCIAKFVSSYPGKSFMDIASIIVTKPVAMVLTLLLGLVMLNVSSYQVISISEISQKYLFSRTPIEIIGLTFLLVVVYAVSGSRAGIFRLNMMFFPIIIFITIIVLVFSIQNIELGHLQPIFQTSFHGYLRGIKNGTISYGGMSILFFYIQFMREPKEAPKMAVIGIGITTVVYLLLFVVTIGLFSNSVTSNILYPTIELAKSVEIPGEFFERFESVFFVIWIMAIFNTTAIALDITILSLTSVFTNVSKLKMLYIVSPLVFFISMIPRDIPELQRYVSWLGSASFIYTLFVLVLLFLLSKMRRIK